ncbi:MAG: inositol monophosphatase family protein [Spirochaetales bacterium]
MPSLNEIADVAKKAAAAAREVQLRGLREGTKVRNKGRTNDLVTEADEESERVIASTVLDAFPGHNFLGEESGNAGRNSEWLWVVDPIDGTTNYSRGIPYFSCSIAVYHHGAPVFGLVSNPVVDETFWAVEGQGAFLNDSPIRASQVATFPEALLVTGFYYDRGKNIDLTLNAISSFYDQGIMGIRRFGSAALDLCYLAAGRIDGYFEIGLNAWDFAAGEYIARTAGALTSDALGQPLPLRKTALVCGTRALHPQMLALLPAWGDYQREHLG